jgi:hypothetical protein
MSKGPKNLGQIFNPISARIMRGASMGAWFLSRRDSTIIARHEVPQPRRGYRTQPRVSTLGNLKNERFALKGREATDELAPIAAGKIRVREKRAYFHVANTFGLPPLQLQGASLGELLPGLKPWAEPSGPFGAKTPKSSDGR